MNTTLQRGFTLIELMVALIISVTVMFGVGYAYLNQRVDTTTQREVLTVQGEAQLALNQLGIDIRQAGFLGCNSNLARNTPKQSTEVTISNVSADPLTLHAGNVLRIFKPHRGLGDIPPGAKPDSHIVEVRYVDGEGGSMLGSDISNSNGSATFFTQYEVRLSHAEAGPTSGPYLGLLSDCSGGVVVPIETPVGAGNKSLVQVNKDLSVGSCGNSSNIGSPCVYWRSTALWPLRVVQYYVKNDNTLYSRQRLMKESTQPDWLAEQIVVKRVSSLKLVGLGLDGVNAYDPITWGVTQTVTNPKSLDAYLQKTGSPGNGWERVVRVDLRLSMEGTAVGTSDNKLYRDYPVSYTVRARTSPETTL